jgi:YggT family protein
MGYVANAGTLIVNALFGIVMFILVLRVLLQVARANFYNPVCQGIYKVTNPVLMPLQKAIPNWKALNMAGVVLAWVLACLWIAIPAWIQGRAFGIGAILVLGFAQLLLFTLETLFWITIVRVVLSWVAGDSDNPVVPLVYRISDLLLKPFQRVIPPLGGIDLSPLVALLAVKVAEALIVHPLFDIGASLAA